MKTMQFLTQAIEQEFAVKVELVPTASGRQRDDIIGVVFFTDGIRYIGIHDSIADQPHYLTTGEIRKIARTAEVNRTDAYDQASICYSRLQNSPRDQVKQRFDEYMDFFKLNKFYFTNYEIRCIHEDLEQYNEIIKEVQS